MNFQSAATVLWRGRLTKDRREMLLEALPDVVVRSKPMYYTRLHYLLSWLPRINSYSHTNDADHKKANTWSVWRVFF